ncbi:proline-specific peptidase [Heliocybe sulcata]|uniref:Proline-specific peptidase n=1 Tax=Heliocybe sulcata TaxID=5364 RepID=A0A5C3MS09_9AGAM|nr:proline-specific peptidase [Heliocybe sulcata]
MSNLVVTDGMIPFVVGNETFETYYKLVGDISSSPSPACIVLHGGPGISHDYLTPISDLAAGPSAIPIIFYDQIGNGRSTALHHKNISFWTIDLFIDELENLLAHFRISDNHAILGHSWGAMLASEFIIRRQPQGLRRLVLSNGLVSAKLCSEARAELRKQLPQDVQDGLKKHEDEGTTKSDEYKSYMSVFWQTFGCRVTPSPPDVSYSMSLADTYPTVHDSMMNGPAGLGDKWDIRDRFHLMRHVPALLINGEFDYMTDDVCGPWFWALDRVKWYKFSNSSHMPWYEERELYMTLVGSFLRQ